MEWNGGLKWNGTKRYGMLRRRRGELRLFRCSLVAGDRVNPDVIVPCHVVARGQEYRQLRLGVAGAMR